MIGDLRVHIGTSWTELILRLHQRSSLDTGQVHALRLAFLECAPMSPSAQHSRTQDASLPRERRLPWFRGAQALKTSFEISDLKREMFEIDCSHLGVFAETLGRRACNTTPSVE